MQLFYRAAQNYAYIDAVNISFATVTTSPPVPFRFREAIKHHGLGKLPPGLFID